MSGEIIERWDGVRGDEARRKHVALGAMLAIAEVLQ